MDDGVDTGHNPAEAGEIAKIGRRHVLAGDGAAHPLPVRQAEKIVRAKQRAERRDDAPGRTRDQDPFHRSFLSTTDRK